MPQHLSGIMNSIADWLSFEGEERIKHGTEILVINPTASENSLNHVVSNIIVSSFPQLVPAGFKISHLPKEVILFACQAVQIFDLSLMQKQRGELEVELLLQGVSQRRKSLS